MRCAHVFAVGLVASLVSACGGGGVDTPVPPRATAAARAAANEGACTEADLAIPGVCAGPWSYDLFNAGCYASQATPHCGEPFPDALDPSDREAHLPDSVTPANCTRWKSCQDACFGETTIAADTYWIAGVSLHPGYGGTPPGYGGIPPGTSGTSPYWEISYWGMYRPAYGHSMCEPGQIVATSAYGNDLTAFCNARADAVRKAQPSYLAVSGVIQPSDQSCNYRRCVVEAVIHRPGWASFCGAEKTFSCAGPTRDAPAANPDWLCQAMKPDKVIPPASQCPAATTQHTCDAVYSDPTAVPATPDYQLGTYQWLGMPHYTTPCRRPAHGEAIGECGTQGVARYTAFGLSRGDLDPYAAGPTCLTGDDRTDTYGMFEVLRQANENASSYASSGVDAAQLQALAIAKLKLLLALRVDDPALSDDQRQELRAYVLPLYETAPDAHPSCGGDWVTPVAP